MNGEQFDTVHLLRLNKLVNNEGEHSTNNHLATPYFDDWLLVNNESEAAMDFQMISIVFLSRSHDPPFLCLYVYVDIYGIS